MTEYFDNNSVGGEVDAPGECCGADQTANESVRKVLLYKMSVVPQHP